MFWDRPENVPPTPAETDLHERLVPDPAAIETAVAALAAMPDPDHAFAVIPMALPNKTRGIWAYGQEVVTVPEERDVRVCREYNLHAHTDAADQAARAWLDEHGLMGTTAYALVTRDGAAAVFEGWR